VLPALACQLLPKIISLLMLGSAPIIIKKTDLDLSPCAMHEGPAMNIFIIALVVHGEGSENYEHTIQIYRYNAFV